MAKQKNGGGGQETALQELYRHSQSLLRLSRTLEQAEDYNDVLLAARREVSETLGYPTIWVYLFSKDGQYAYPLAADGTASETILHDDKAARLTIVGDPMLEEIVSTRGIVVVEDARTDPRTDKKIVAHLGNRTIINVPILFLDRHLGSIGMGTFGDEGIRVPSPTEKDYLTSLASSLAVTLDRVHLQHERKQAEETLRSQRDQLSNIYATSPVGITMVDRSGQIVNANPQAEKVLGLEKEAILQLQYNTPAWKITDLDGSPFPDEQLPFTRVKTTGLPVKDVQHAIQWPDGQRVLLSINAAPLFDEAGQFDGMIASIEDITERKHAETTAQESAQALREAQRIAHLGSWYMDLATNEVYWSEELYKMYGFDPTLPPPLYTESAKLFTPESWEQLNSAIAQAVEKGTPYEIELEMKSKEGEHKWMLARGELVRDAQGRPARVRGIAQDITEQKILEEKLRDSEQQFRSLAENSPDNIVRYDRQCRLIYYNPAMARTIPTDLEKSLGKTPTQLGFGDPEISAEYERHIRHVLESGESSDLELAVPSSDGSIHNHLVRFTAERDSRENITSVLAIGRDITELKLIDDALFFVAQHGWQTDAENFFDALVQFLGKKFDVDYVIVDKLGEKPDVAETVALYAKGAVAPNIQYALKDTPCENVMGRQLCLYPHSVQQQFPKDTLLAEMGVESYIGIPLWDSFEQPIGLIALMDSKPLPEVTLATQILQLVATRAAAELEREQSDRILRTSEQRFHAIFDQSFQFIGLLSPDGTLLEANHAALEFAALEENDVLGKPFWELPWWSHSVDLQQQLRSAIEEAASGKFIRFDVTHPDKDGNLHYVDFSLKPVIDPDGRVVQLIPEGRDITELKQAEEKILQSEQRLRLHAEQSPLGFLVWDEHFCASDWNAACEKIFGYTREEAIGRHAKDLILPVEIRGLVDGIFQDLMHQTGGTHSINENVTKDGRTIIVEWFNTTLVNKDGRPVGVASICRDITELKLIENERQLHAEFLTNMDRINRAIQSANDLETMMRDVLDEVLDIFNCDRAFLVYPCDPAAEFWGVPMERTRPEYPGAGITNEDIPMDAEVAATLKLLLSNPGTVKFGPETEHPLPQDVSERYGFKSFMSIALYPKVGKAWQFGVHQCSYGRVWTDMEEQLLEEIGQRISDGLTSLLILRDLRDSEARYQRMFDTANEGIWIQDENFVTTFVNDHMANMLGYSATELMTHKVTEFMLEEDAIDHSYKMEERSKHISDVYERRMLHKNGNVVWMLISATPVFEGDRFHGSFAMLTDITARKEAEQKLASSEQLFRTLVEHSPDYIARYDRDIRRTYINPALQQLFSISTQQTIGNSPAVTSPLTDPERYTAHIKQVFETGSECSDELTYRKPDGEIRWSNSRFIPEFGLNGEVATVMVISSDITERKRTEEELVRSEEKFSKAFYASPTLMAITNPEDGLIVDINESFCRFFGYTREECVGHNTAELHMWVDPKQRERIVNKLKHTGAALYEPVELRTKSGEIRSVIDSLTFIHIDNQKYLLSVATDITERKKAEEVLRDHKQHLEEIVEQRTEALSLARDAADAANRAKSVFLANMSHELRTPLNAILGFSQMMQQDSHLSTTQHETLDIINNSGEHLLKLINDVLEIAKIEAGKLQLDIATFDLHSLIREVTDMMRLRAEQKGLKLELDQSSAFPRYIRGDEARLRQILVNLISNAVKFTDKGKVTIRLTIKNNARHHLVIEIEDSGPGISKEDQQRLFKPFVQLSEGKTHIGSGLGLSIVHQFVQLMKGNIAVESTPGKGSLFRVELPLDEAEQIDVERLSSEQHGEVTGLVPGQPAYRILITEDQHDNQLLLAKLMTDIGMEVKTADNGRECVEIFKKWKPDLIWMDHRMPIMDGVEATRRIRKLRGGNEVKIVAVTASAFKEQQSELLDAGMDGFVRKPYQFSEIYDSMARQLGIQFTYNIDTQDASARIEPLDPQKLSVLTPELRAELQQALESLDREQIRTTIHSIELADKKLGRTLLHIADEFDYPTILSALAAAAKE